MKLEAFLPVALPVIGALLAAGAVLWIKAMRRMHAPPWGSRRDDVADAVPARPVSGEQLARWRRRYLLAVANAGLGLVAYAIVLGSIASSAVHTSGTP